MSNVENWKDFVAQWSSESFLSDDLEHKIECPECSKNNIYFSISIKNQEEHLLEHYRMKYYYKYEKVTKNKCRMPWKPEYIETEKEKLAEFMDTNIFRQFLENLEKIKENKKIEMEKRDSEIEKQKLRLIAWRNRIQNNEPIFSTESESSDDDRQPEPLKIQRSRNSRKRKMTKSSASSTGKPNFKNNFDNKNGFQGTREPVKKKRNLTNLRIPFNSYAPKKV